VDNLRTLRVLALLLCLVAPPALAQHKASTPTPTPMPGETVYRSGILPTGKSLRGEREAGIFVEGAAAACATCHRRSGLGTAEGQIIIPPITGTYLFRPRGKQIEDMDLRYVQGHGFNREAHTDASLARAIREGVGKNGQKLNYLMPRFNLDDATLAALIAYLKELSKPPYRGATEDTLHFATIITPDANPVERQGMLDVLERFFTDKNEFTRGGSRPLRSTSSGVSFRVNRKWQLHVWQLTGPADGWEQQLRQRLAAEPVLAVISGLGGKTWAPVHRFCEQASVPCLLPNVELPVVAEDDFYPMYFSKGVLLEAQLVAKQLEAPRGAPPLRRLVQVYRAGDIGEAAAQALETAAAATGLTLAKRVLGSGASEQQRTDAIKDLTASDALMLWLRPDDLSALPAGATEAGAVFVSGLMGNLEQAPLPAAWRGIARIAYPADLPEMRKFRLNFPLTWFKIKHIPVVAEHVQVDTYIACGILAEMLGEMLDSFVPDYLEERIESMLSYRKLTGYYPRLGLAQGQRFASKGGYIARFADAQGTRLLADSEWIVP
jgi:hypothetical protein